MGRDLTPARASLGRAGLGLGFSRGLLALFVILIAGAAAAPLTAAQSPCARGVIALETPDGPFDFTVEIAETPEERARGLMFREEMAADAGMLFLFPDERRRSFWMKNTILSLDMLFIDGEGRVCDIAERTVPYSLDGVSSSCAAVAVLEINGGEARRRGIGPGALARHPAFPDPIWPCD